MPKLDLNTDLDREPWSDLKDAPSGDITRAGRLRRGTIAGNSVVFVAIRLPDGSHVTGQTTLALFQHADACFRGAEIRDGVAPQTEASHVGELAHALDLAASGLVDLTTAQVGEAARELRLWQAKLEEGN